MARRVVALSLLCTLLAPALALAQSSKAGIVTTLEGNVSARRVALVDPVSLKFKDDVFLQDTVTTGDKALARMLLGGKAVVTVRERSVLTITEVPGRSTLELETGKFSLAVAREKMRPGEEIQIRTPNAIAGVRGTVVVTEVNRQSAQAGGGAPAVLTSFYVLRGSIVAQQLDPGTRQPTGAPLQVGSLQSYSGAGSAAPRVAPVSTEQVSQITAGLKPSGPKNGVEAGKEQVKAQAVQTATTLLSTLTGGDAQVALATAPAGRPARPQGQNAPSQRERAPIIAAVAGSAPQKAAEQTELKAASNALTDLLTQLALLLGDVSTTSTSFLRLSGTTKLLTTAPVFDLNGELVVQTGTDALISVDASAVVTMAGALLRAVDTTVFSQATGLDVRGSITDTFAGAFLQLDGSNFTVAGNMVNLSGGVPASLTLAGPLFRSTNGFVHTGGANTRSFLVIHDGAVVRDTTSAPFITLSNTTLSLVGSLLSLRKSGSSASTLELAGPFLSMSSSSITARSEVLRDQSGALRLCCALWGVGQGAVFTGTGTGALFDLTNSFLSAGQNLFVLFDTTSIFGEATITKSATATLAGGLVRATDTHFIAPSDFLGVFRSSFTSTSTDALVRLNGGSTTTGRFFHLSANASTAATMSLAGPLLTASGVKFITTDDVFGIFNGGSLTDTTTAPFISITGGTVTAGTNGSFLSVASGSGQPGGSRLTLAGTLLSAEATTLRNGNPTVEGSSPSFMFFGDSAVFSSTTPSPLISLVDTTVESAGNFFDVRRGAKATLAGPLLAATDSRIDTTSLGFGSSCCNVFRLGQGGELTGTSTGALVQLVRSMLLAGPDSQSGGRLFRISDQGTATADTPSSSRLTLAGPLIDAVSSTLTSLVANLEIEASTVTGTSTSPFITLANSTLSAGGIDPFLGTTLHRPTLLLVASATPGTVGSDATLSLTGPLLRASSSSIRSSGFNVVNGARYLSTTGQALLTLTNTTLTLDNGSSLNSGFFVSGQGGSSGTGFATLGVRGPLLSASSGSAVTSTGALVFVDEGGEIRADALTDALVSLSGGTHSLNPTLSSTAMVSLTGRATATASETVEGVSLTLGTDRPIVTSGGLADLDNQASVSGQRALRMDTALLEASAPLLNLRGTSSLTTATNALELVQKAKLTSVGPVVKLDGSTLTVTAGALLSVNSGSLLRVTGDFLSLSNTSTLTISNGGLINVSGGSVVTISGALVNFGGTSGNAINVTNSVCGASCPTSGGIQFYATNGATVSVSGAIKNSGLGSITPNGINTAVIIADGASTKVVIQGN